MLVVTSVKIVLLLDSATIHFSTDVFCFESGNFHYIYVDVWPWINLCVGYFIPWIALFVGSIVIVVLLRRNAILEGSPLSQDFQTGSQSSQTGKRSYKISVLTKRVIALNIVYNICVTPTNIMSILYLFGNPVSELVYTILTMFMDVNNSISFFLYILIGSNFRQELTKMLSVIKCPRCFNGRTDPLSKDTEKQEKLRF